MTHCIRPFPPGVVTPVTAEAMPSARRGALQSWLRAHRAGSGVTRVVAIDNRVYVRRRSWPGLALDVCEGGLHA